MGPLHGVKVLEIEAIGPVPWCGMMLSDLGADVVRVDRPAPPRGLPPPDDRFIFARRGRRAVVADLKDAGGLALVRELADRADVLIEGMRPGVMERLGLGPDVCLARNPRLIYGRMTGWGQDGPLAQAAGHDINYIAMAGALHAIGPAGAAPVPPLNLLGDYGGGAMLLALGICAALVEARSSGRGQVVDAAMIDGVTSLMTPLFGQLAAGIWRDQRGANTLDGGAPWYGVYETADGRHVAVGAVEPQFYAALLHGLGLTEGDLPPRSDRSRWPEARARLAAIFRTRSRDAWVAAFDGVDACLSPVLSLAEAQVHPAARARAAFVAVDGQMHPAPAPRFSRTAAGISRPPGGRGDGAEDALRDWGLRR